MAARHPPNYLVIIKCKNINELFYFSKKPKTGYIPFLGIFFRGLFLFFLKIRNMIRVVYAAQIPGNRHRKSSFGIQRGDEKGVLSHAHLPLLLFLFFP